MRRLFCLICLALGACTQFPDLDAAQTPGVQDAPYPRLLPLDSLLDAPEPRAELSQIPQVQARVDGLRGNADGVQAGAPDASGVAERVDRLRERAADLQDTQVGPQVARQRAASLRQRAEALRAF